MTEAQQQTFVVMEDGAEWPAWLGRVAGSGEGTLTVLQQPEEQLAAFAGRVAERVAELAEQWTDIALAVIACSERADEGVRQERRQIASSVARAMAAVGSGGRVLLTESQRKSGGSRRALSELAADLGHQWEEAGVQFSVRFGQPSRPPQGAMLDFDSCGNGAVS